MKLAVLGDIHGNIEALKAAYDRALKETPQEIIHLGDLGGYAPFVNEVVDFLRERGIRGVQGNYDYNVAMHSEHCGCKYEDPTQARLSQFSFDWTKIVTTDRSREFMAALPAILKLNAEGKAVSLFHATPNKNNIYWFADRPVSFFMEMAEKAGADVMIYGHTHKPYHKEMEGKVFINAGSVGRPKDRNPKACLAMVEIGKDGVKTEFIRVAYDVERMASAIVRNGLPAAFADGLRKGL